MVSLASIDAFLGSVEPESFRDQDLLEMYGGREDPEAERRTMYLRGRLLQEAGKAAEAAAEFQKLVDLGGNPIEPHLRLAESLRDAGNPEAAEQHLRQALERRTQEESWAGQRELWNCWLAVCLADLGGNPGDLLANGMAEGDYLDDLRWLLSELESGSSIRINCGGDDYVSPEGETWGKDRFFLGGRRRAADFPGKIANTECDPLYDVQRLYPREELSRGYRIPLPAGSYRIVLHFAEVRWHFHELSRFDVAIEGERILEAYDPRRHGFATPAPKSSEKTIRDGILDIEFTPRIGVPHISAIEIERL
jgi:tetratricopeptide (TPR) repeat protein